MKILFNNFIKKNMCLVVLSFLLAIGFICVQLYIPIVIGEAIDLISLSLWNDIVSKIILISVLIVLVVVLQYFFEFFANMLNQNIIKQLRDNVYKKLNYVPVSYIDCHFKGDLVLRCVNDIENIGIGLIGGIKQLIQGIVLIIATLCFMFYVNWFLALIIVIITPLSIFISSFIAKKCSRYFKKQAQFAANLSSISFETLKNYETINAYNYEIKQYDKFYKENSELYKVGQKAQFYSSWINPTTRFINNLTYAVVLMVGLIMIINNNFLIAIGLSSFSIGALQSLLVYTNQYAKPFNEISSVISEIQSAIVSLKRVNDLLAEKDEIDCGKKSINGINELSFDKISFSYDDIKTIIDNISFKIKKGQRIAIVGPTGCGKTTLINLLLRFYETNNGVISINNEDVTNIKKASLRKSFAMVLQDSRIFSGTILDNIKYSKYDATLDEVIDASKKANAHGFIKRFKDGYNTQIDANSGLSTGEKQLICIARMILTNPSFVILDEATSNIDTRTEKKISKAFDALLENRTSIVIAHRLSTIINSDLIIVLDKGKIIEQGTHRELINKKGYYFKLYNSQYEKKSTANCSAF